jgi:cell division ATPase FtsA
LTGLKYTDVIDRIIMCGGGAKTIGLAPFLSRRLGYNIKLGDPWVNVNFKGTPPIDRETAVQYATVIGLATKKI